MADGWGNVVGNWQAYVNAWVSAQTDTKATVHVEVYAHSIGWGFDVYADGQCAVNGTWSGKRSFTFYAPSGSTTNVLGQSYDLVVNKGNGSGWWCNATGVINVTGGYQNGRSQASASVWIPSRTYKNPRPPKSVALKPVSDGQQVVSWQPDYTGMDGDYPWTYVYVDRRTDGGAWVNITRLSWSAVSYADYTTQPDHMYEYRVASWGPGGWSTYVTAGTVYTTPAAPTSVTLSKVSAGTVLVDITGRARYAQGYPVQRNLNGSGWVDAGTATSFPYSDVPGGGTVRYRVRAMHGDRGSVWTESGELVTITEPNAPAVTGMEPAYPTGMDVTVSWVPNHPDGTAQTSAEVEVTYPDGTARIETVSGDSTELTLRGLAKGSYRVRVRTKGLADGWGAWSGYAAFNVAVPTQGNFTYPATDQAVVDALPLTLTWQVSDETGIASQSILVTASDGEILYAYDLAGDVRELTVKGTGYFSNKQSYTARITARSGSGLSVTFSREFRTDWRSPARPNVTVTYDDDFAVQVDVTAGEEDGAPETTWFSAYLSYIGPMGDAVRVQLGSADGSAASFKYALPPLGEAYTVGTVAHAASGAVYVVEEEFECDSGGAEMFNFPPPHDTFDRGAIALTFDASVSESAEHSGEEFHFANLTGLPEYYPDGGLDVTGTHSYVIKGREEFMRARRLFRANPVCWYRSAIGRVAFVAVRASFSYSAKSYELYEVSLSLTEVAWEDYVG